MYNRKLNIDEIASIRNKHYKQLNDKYRKENPDKDILLESEIVMKNTDISII